MCNCKIQLVTKRDGGSHLFPHKYMNNQISVMWWEFTSKQGSLADGGWLYEHIFQHFVVQKWDSKGEQHPISSSEGMVYFQF